MQTLLDLNSVAPVPPDSDSVLIRALPSSHHLLSLGGVLSDFHATGVLLMTVQCLGGIISLATHDLSASSVPLATVGAGKPSYVVNTQGV